MYANEAGMNACQVNCSCGGMAGAVRPHTSSFFLMGRQLQQLHQQFVSWSVAAAHRFRDTRPLLLICAAAPAQALNTVYKEAATLSRPLYVSNTTGTCMPCHCNIDTPPL